MSDQYDPKTDPFWDDPWADDQWPDGRGSLPEPPVRLSSVTAVFPSWHTGSKQGGTPPKAPSIPDPPAPKTSKTTYTSMEPKGDSTYAGGQASEQADFTKYSGSISDAKPIPASAGAGGAKGPTSFDNMVSSAVSKINQQYGTVISKIVGVRPPGSV